MMEDLSYLENRYPNMVIYAENFIKTFDKAPLNEVDCLIFSWLIYLNIHEEINIAFSSEGAPLKELFKAEYFEAMFDKTWSRLDTFELLSACASSPRFRDVRMKYYRNEMLPDINLQFAAIVFSISDNKHVVAFRGTDWSITGWKEDALLALQTPIPAQRIAGIYMDEIGKACDGTFTIVGHSKGGNIAVYASAHCCEEVQEKIETIYSFDGPGILKKELYYPGFLKIKDRIQKFVPQSSYFGMLFESETKQKIVFSNEKSVMQHNPISWKVEGCKLSIEEKQSHISSYLNERINSWLNTLSEEERKMLIQAIFDVLRELNVASIDEFMANPNIYIFDAYRVISKMDGKRRKYLRHIIRLLIKGDAEKQNRPESPDEVKFEADDDRIEREFHFFIPGDKHGI